MKTLWLAVDPTRLAEAMAGCCTAAGTLEHGQHVMDRLRGIDASPHVPMALDVFHYADFIRRLMDAVGVSHTATADDLLAAVARLRESAS